MHSVTHAIRYNNTSWLYLLKCIMHNSLNLWHITTGNIVWYVDWFSLSSILWNSTPVVPPHWWCCNVVFHGTCQFHGTVWNFTGSSTLGVLVTMSAIYILLHITFIESTQIANTSQLLYLILISDYVNLSLIASLVRWRLISNRLRCRIHCCNDITFVVVGAIRRNHMKLSI